MTLESTPNDYTFTKHVGWVVLHLKKIGKMVLQSRQGFQTEFVQHWRKISVCLSLVSGEDDGQFADIVVG